MSKHISNFQTGNVTKKFEVSTDSLRHTDFKFGLTFNFVMSQTKLAAQTSLFFTFGIRRNFFFLLWRIIDLTKKLRHYLFGASKTLIRVFSDTS